MLVSFSNLFSNDMAKVFYRIYVWDQCRPLYVNDIFLGDILYAFSSLACSIVMHKYCWLNWRYKKWRNDMLFKKVVIQIWGLLFHLIIAGAQFHRMTDLAPNFISFFTHIGFSLFSVTRRTNCSPSDPTKLNFLSSRKYPLSQSVYRQRT